MKKIASNMYEKTISNGTLLYSYETPVAARIGDYYFKTDTKYSQTTTRHINKWNMGSPEEKPQSFFDELGAN